MNQLPHYNFNHSSNKIPSAPLEGKSKILQWQQSLKSKHKNWTKGNIIPLIINTLYVISCFKGRSSDATKINLFFYSCKSFYIVLIISDLSTPPLHPVQRVKMVFQKTNVFWNTIVYPRPLYLIVIHKLTHNKSGIKQPFRTYTRMYKSAMCLWYDYSL